MPAALIPAALGVAQTIAGFFNKGKAKREARELEASRPDYEVNPLYQQSLDLAESEVGGLSARAENAYNQLNDKQFSSSLDAILKSGGSANNIASVYNAGEEGRLRLATLNDQLRMNQINNLVNSRRVMADQEDKAWQWNEQAPFLDRSQANAQARQGAENQIWGGLQTAGSAAMQYIDGRNQQNQFNDYLRTTGGNNSPMQTNVMSGRSAQPVGINSSYGTMTPYNPNPLRMQGRQPMIYRQQNNPQLYPDYLNPFGG